VYEIGNRLRSVREGSGLSTRAFAARIGEEGGFEISHSSVWKYERTDGVPGDYLAAVCRTFGVDPGWLLAGDVRPGGGASGRLQRTLRTVEGLLETLRDGGDGSAATELADVQREWERFQGGLPRHHPLRDVILRSWRRSREAGVAAESGAEPLFRVGPEVLARRRRSQAALLRVARPHLDGLSATLGTIPHVVSITDADGIVLDALSPDDGMPENAGLAPGFDWSEARMGTNGVGTALATGEPVAVVGPEHYSRLWHDFISTAAPIRGPDERPVGALDVSTALADGVPMRLGVVTYAALVIGWQLRDGEGAAP
jgi:transcriptional regulator with XRE-family HTH domain